MNLTSPPPIDNIPPHHLSISELVTAVRTELDRVERDRKAANRAALFQLTQMEITVQFVVSINETAQGGFDLKVVSVGGEREASSEKTQSVTLKYEVLQSVRGLPGAIAAMEPSDSKPGGHIM